MVQFKSLLVGYEVEWLFKQENISQFVKVLSRYTVFIEELSEKQDGQKLECRTKTHGWKREFNLFVICEYNLEGLRGASYKCISSIRVSNDKPKLGTNSLYFYVCFIFQLRRFI